MKLSSRNISTCLILMVFSAIVGTFAWEVLERLVSLTGVTLDLRVGPLGFDSGVLAIRLMVNPGTLIGVPLGYRIFRTA